MIDTLERGRREKAITLAAILLVGFLILAGRLFQMQVLVWEEYLARADENRIRPERLAALRGKIYDRNGAVLADSRPSFSVSIVPYQVRKNPEVLDRLGDLIGVEPDRLRERVRKGFSRPYEPRPVLRDVDLRTVSIIEERGYDLSGVLIESEPVRRYPEGSLAAHVIGYMGEVSEKEIAASRVGGSGLAVGMRVGRAGIEREYDSRLRGKDGVRYVQEDARGRPLGTLRETDPLPGEDLYLTIDAPLQALAESLLADYRGGAVVALDPVGGDVLALASFPTFDPNLFSVAVSGVVWDSLSTDPAHPMLDRALQSAFPPGSTFKPVTAAVGLIDGLIRPDMRLLPCLGSYKFGRRVYRCWLETGHGSLRLTDAIARSCDVYFYQVGAGMDLDHFAGVAGDFGLGRKTGIDLPGERSGLVPSKKYMNNRYGKSGWGAGFQLNHAIGQGEILTTPLQVACFYGALGTGERVRPRLLREAVAPDGSIVAGPTPALEKVNLPAKVLDELREGITAVIEDDRGTGTAARIPGIVAAGKTGTAENPHGTEHAWFVAYAPVEAPVIVVVVFLEQAGHGGAEAAPVAGKLLRRYFRGGGV